MQFLKLVVVLGIVGLAYGLIAKETEMQYQVPLDWELVDRVDPNAMIKLTFAIKQQNLDKLETIFWEVSSPDHENYGNHLSYDQLCGLITPKRSHIKAIEKWLYENEVHDLKYTQGKEFLVARMPVGVAERLLNVQYFNFINQRNGHEIMRCTAPYYLPEDVAEAVDFVGGTVRFPSYRELKVSDKIERDYTNIYPAVIKSAFNIPASIRGYSTNNSQAVAQFLGEFYAPSDLQMFQQMFNLTVNPVTKVVGPNNATNPGLESSLDIEYIMGMAQNVPSWFVYTDGLHEGQEPFLDWILNMINTSNTPWVHSVSYGDYENSLTPDYMNRVSVEFQKFGAMGRSILFASGDDGVGCDNSCDYFVPNFPASSPYVTAVGGITTTTGSDMVGDSISSGGFSNIFKAQSWQSKAIAQYMSTGSAIPPNSYFNSTGRGVPDLCSFSENVNIVAGGGDMYVGGTSCAAPVVAGVISLLNDARMMKGKSTLGFLNPWLYSIPSDAFLGNNGDGCCNNGNGFNAAVGWDPITGLGAPNFPNLLKYALQK